MLDPGLLKDNLEALKLNILRRNLDVDIDFLINLNNERKKLRFEAEQKRAEQKEIGKAIATADEESKETFSDFQVFLMLAILKLS